MTVTIEGRNRYADKALTKITVRNPLAYGPEAVVLEIVGGYIEQHPATGRFTIAAKHPSATDEEHDSAYVAQIEGAGLVWKDMYGPTHSFTGALLAAKFYSETPEVTGRCDRCEDEEAHGFLPFIPPDQKWTPGAYEIEILHFSEGVRIEDVPLAGVSMRRGEGRFGFEPGDRVEHVLLHGKGTRPGTVSKIEDYLLRHERLIVAFDNGETRSINPDVMRRIQEVPNG